VGRWFGVEIERDAVAVDEQRVLATVAIAVEDIVTAASCDAIIARHAVRVIGAAEAEQKVVVGGTDSDGHAHYVLEMGDGLRIINETRRGARVKFGVGVGCGVRLSKGGGPGTVRR
jgi:hypothetical protein